MKTIMEKINRYFQEQWRIAVLDLQKGLWTIDPQPSAIPYLKAQNAMGRHIIMQPINPSCYLLADDLAWSTVRRHHRRPDGTWKPGRMVVETSPANFQVWIHCLESLSLDEKRILLQKLLSDPAADPNNRFGRCPGFRNRKEKHRTPDGLYPLAKLIWVDWKHKATIPQRLRMTSPKHQTPLSNPPQGGPVCRNKEISRKDYERGNESRTDFSYAMALARRGCTDEQIRSRIRSERANWANHQGEPRINHYLDRTITRAKTIVQAS